MSNIVDDIVEAQKLQTANLIETAGRMITLVRQAPLVDDGAGGKKRSAGADVPQAPKMRYFGAASGLGRGAFTRPVEWVTTSLGEKYSAAYVLVGVADDDIQVDDYFTINNKRYDVLFLHEDVDAYQKKATVGLVK